jgi:hypothetical protein
MEIYTLVYFQCDLYAFLEDHRRCILLKLVLVSLILMSLRASALFISFWTCQQRSAVPEAGSKSEDQEVH